MARLRVKPFDGNEHLIKDTQNKAVINEDNHGFINYITKRDRSRSNDIFKYDMENRVKDLEADINNIKSDIGDIKSMLNILINR